VRGRAGLGNPVSEQHRSRSGAEEAAQKPAISPSKNRPFSSV